MIGDGYAVLFRPCNTNATLAGLRGFQGHSHRCWGSLLLYLVMLWGPHSPNTLKANILTLILYLQFHTSL